MLKEMVRAKPTNTRTADTDTNHSIVFTLLLEINDMDKGGYSSKCKIAPAELLPLMTTYRPTAHYLNISVKSDHK